MLLLLFVVLSPSFCDVTPTHKLRTRQWWWCTFLLTLLGRTRRDSRSWLGLTQSVFGVCLVVLLFYVRHTDLRYIHHATAAEASAANP